MNWHLPSAGLTKNQLFILHRSNPEKDRTQLIPCYIWALTSQKCRILTSHIRLLAMAGIADQNSPEKQLFHSLSHGTPEEVKTKAPATEQKATSKAAEPEKKTAETKVTPPPSSNPVAATPTQENKDVVVYRVQILANTRPVGSS